MDIFFGWTKRSFANHFMLAGCIGDVTMINGSANGGLFVKYDFKVKCRFGSWLLCISTPEKPIL